MGEAYGRCARLIVVSERWLVSSAIYASVLISGCVWLGCGVACKARRERDETDSTFCAPVPTGLRYLGDTRIVPRRETSCLLRLFVLRARLELWLCYV